jgi:hypothetical protein
MFYNRPPAKEARSIKEFDVPEPLSLFGANLLARINECKGGVAKSDSLSDLSLIGWRLILSFLGLLS